jgi:putative tryptophan/tyrosine transport system substrate-binding protein
VVGYLYLGSPEYSGYLLEAFRSGLREMGYVEGQNVSIEFRWARNDINRLAEMAADLVHRRVDVIAALASQSAALAAKAATTTIPIVFSIGADPIELGLVASLHRPGGNTTGITFMNSELMGKRLALLQELVPRATRFALLINPGNPAAGSMIADLNTAVSSKNGQIDVHYVTSNREIDSAFLKLVQRGTDALLVSPDVLFANNRTQITALAAHHRVPANYGARAFVEIGGLMSYGDDRLESFRLHGIQVGRILKGEKPADLPVQRVYKFEFAINLRTAKMLNLPVPRKLLAFADHLFE